MSQVPQSANDRFKQTYGRVFWTGMLLAVALHLAFFQLAPELKAMPWPGKF